MTFLNPPRTRHSGVGTLRCCPRTFLNSPRTLRSSVGTLRCCPRTFLNSPRTLRSSVGTLRCCPRTFLNPPTTFRLSVGILRSLSKDPSVGTLRSLYQDCRQDSCTSSHLLAQVFLLLIEEFPCALSRLLGYLIHCPSTTSRALV